MNKTDYVLSQYKDGDNLNTCVMFYKKYDKRKIKHTTWINQNYEFFDGCKILELGSGTGKDWTDFIESVSQRCNLTLSDFTTGMVEDLKSKYGKYKNVNILQADIQNIPFKANEFDFIIANAMLYHVPDIDKALVEVSRVMKPNATFYSATIGNKSLFDFFREILPDIDSKITLPSIITFTLQSGKKYVNKYFNEVKINKSTNTLFVTDAKDLVDFAFSTISIEGLNDYNREKVFKHLMRKKMTTEKLLLI